MRKIILFVVLLGICAALAVDVSFVDNILEGQTKFYRVGDGNITVKIFYFGESETLESQVILSVSGEETKLLSEGEEDVILDGKVVVRIYDILSSEKRVRFGILGSGFWEDTQKFKGIPRTRGKQSVSGDIKENVNKNVGEENLSLENFIYNETDMMEENSSDENEILDEKKDAMDEQSVLWKSADIKEKRVGFFARIWKWFISLFEF